MQSRLIKIAASTLILAFLAGCTGSTQSVGRALACAAFGAALGAAAGSVIGDPDDNAAYAIPAVTGAMGGTALCMWTAREEEVMRERPESGMADLAVMDVIQSPMVMDADQDGVLDEDDRCPDSGPLDNIDAFGCHAAPDVAEAIPSPTAGDATIAGLTDGDRDGVPDARDRCPNTQPGVAVDEDGCARVGEVMAAIEERVHFAFDSARLMSGAAEVLDRVMSVLMDNRNIHLDVVGHTDDAGTDAYNLELGRRRAQAAYDYLIRRGVAAHQLRVLSKGESEPAATNNNAYGRSVNRRVEFVVNGKN